MEKERQLILTAIDVERKLERMAREILESNYSIDKVFLVGLKERGAKVAKKIFEILKGISPKEFVLIELEKEEETDVFEKRYGDELTGSSVILIDDVLNSGKTLISKVCFLMRFKPSQLSTLVLVDRKHRKFPVRADFVGLTLSTTLKEHISVVEDKKGGFLVFLD